LEAVLGRVINPEHAGEDRTQIVRGIVLALRELAQKLEVDQETRDLASFIGLGLIAIWDGVEASVAPWEKRGYWIKADRFRMEWTWSQRLGFELQQAVLEDDWIRVAQLTGQVAGKLGNVKLPQRNRLGTPWTGAWQRLSSQPLKNIASPSHY
jgi:hypothetical protein